MKISAQVVLINPSGLILGVSRKDNHNDFGLIGGKGEIEDNGDPMVTAIRETKEETGLDITNLQLIFATHKDGYMGYTYLAQYSGEINHNEPHVVKWVPMQVLINGSFGKYNELVAESLEDMGVEFEMDIDEEALISDLNEFMKHVSFSGYKVSVKGIQFTKDWLDKSHYHLYLNGVVEETCDLDETFEKGIDAIAENYGVKLRIPHYYYSK